MREDSRSGIAASTAFETSTVLAAGSFVTAIVSAGSPLTRDRVVTGSDCCATVATSPIVVCPAAAWAASVGTSGSAVISSTLVSFAPVWTVRVWSPSLTDPPGNSTPFASSASLIACWLNPRSPRRVGSGVIVTRWPVPPTTCAAFTPFTSSSAGTTTDSSVDWMVCASE